MYDGAGGKRMEDSSMRAGADDEFKEAEGM